MQTAVLAKWQLIPLAAVVVAVGLTAAREPATPAQPERPTAAARPADTSEILVQQGMHILFLTPDGTERRRVTFKLENAVETANQFLGSAKSPNRRWELVSLDKIGVPLFESRYAIRPIDGSGPGRELRFKHPVRLFWSPDGRELIGTEYGEQPWPWEQRTHWHWRIDPATGQRTSLPLPAHHYLVGYSADPDRLVTVACGDAWWNRTHRLCLVSRDGKTVEPIADPTRSERAIEDVLPSSQPRPHLSSKPDDGFAIWVARSGRRALVLNRIAGKGRTIRLAVLDLKTRRATPVSSSGWSNAAHVFNAVWSPDGARVAVASVAQTEDKTPDGKSRVAYQLTVIDARTGSSRVVVSQDARATPDGPMTLFDWR